MKILNSYLGFILFFIVISFFSDNKGNKFQKTPELLFQPTLNNLNTTQITFAKTQDISLPIKPIADIVNTIYFDFENLEQTNQIALKNTDKTIKGFCIIEKGISHKTNMNNPYITLVSKAYAKAAAPLDYLPPKTLYQKMVDFICPDLHEAMLLPKKGGGILSAYTAYRDNIIYTDCVNFDYPDTEELTNFGQRLDLNCLNTIYDGIPSSSKIIALGICRGAHVLLKRELLNEGKNRPCALVLESPLFSVTDLILQILKTHLTNLSLVYWISYNVFCAMHHSFDRKQDNLQHLLATKKISPNLPILFIHLKGDPIVSDQAIFDMVKLLAQYNNNIHLFVLHDATKKTHHGALHTLEVFQNVINSFYYHYNLPHDAVRAEKGKQIFATTKENAYNIFAPQDWKLTPVL